MQLTEERVIPKLMNPKNGLLQEHIVRYEFARRFARGRVLDIACGVGYGTEILLSGKQAEKIESIIGIDIDSQSIEYAKEHYNHEKVQFFKRNALSTALVDEFGKFDTIVSFETIEHLEDDEIFVYNLYRLLKPTGTLIISTPHGRGRGIPCSNPFHVHQYKEEEFRDLLRVFKQVEMYKQINRTIEKPVPKEKYYLMVAVCSH